MTKKITLTEQETLLACWGQFDGDDAGLSRKGRYRLRTPESVNHDVLTVINRGRLCTMEEMAKWVGPPCRSYSPGCATCDAWADWRAAFRLLEGQATMRREMHQFEAEWAELTQD